VMEEWRLALDELRRQAEAFVALEKDIDRLSARRRTLRAALAGAIDQVGGDAPPGDTLAPCCARAAAVLADIEQSQAKQRDMIREQQQITEELEQLEQAQRLQEQALVAWRQKWAETSVLPGRQKAVLPEEVRDLLEQADEVRQKYHKAEEFDLRLQGMDRDRQAFAGAVADLVRDCGGDPGALEPPEALLDLKERLDQARQDKALRNQLSRERTEIEAELAQAKTLLATAKQELAGLLALAGCEREQELAGIEQRCREQARLHAQLTETEQELELALAGTDSAEIREELARLDMDTLPGRIREITQQISEHLEPAFRTLAEQRGEVAAALANMDGSDAAARLAEEQASCLAVIRHNAARFVRLQLAVDLLRREMEIFRQANQGPVLALASDIFARLTLHSFSGLTTDLDQRGEPVLVGLRSGSGQPVEVAAMSTGSRDQLFLALRLAAIQHRAEQGQPMMHLFDDVLINFDEERCLATLAELARLGRACQLILFTHQARVAEQAAALDQVTVHDLAGLSAEKRGVSLD